MKSVLVTGATGFTGSRLARRLVADGNRVVAFVRGSSRCDELRELGVECRVVDICDAASVAAHFEAFDTVYHIAAAFRTEHADVQEFYRVNVDATRNLLEASRSAGAGWFVHCSTVGVQGEIDDPPAREEYRYAPGDHYQESKLEGEKVALQFAADGMRVSVVRPVGIYGPGDRRFLKLFRPIARRRFVMIGNGRTLYQLTYIDDLVDGIVLAGTQEAAVGEVFTIGGARYTTLGELVNLIADAVGVARPRAHVPYAPVHATAVMCEKVGRVLGVNPPLYPRRVEFFVKDRAFDITKARTKLGYAPRVDLEEGLQRTAQWYRSEGLL
jgi:nucleoside-diphosphate-sugar epimerase